LVLAAYAVGVTGVSLLTWSRAADRRVLSLLAMPAAFAATHFGWGLGFLEGLLLGRSPAVASGNARTSGSKDAATDRVGSPPRRPGGQTA
jgi:hypothetical protein